GHPAHARARRGPAARAYCALAERGVGRVRGAAGRTGYAAGSGRRSHGPEELADDEILRDGWLCALPLARLRADARGAGAERPLGAPLAPARTAGGAAAPHARPAHGAQRARGVAAMTARRRRLILVIGILAGVGLASALALRAFRQNVTFYFEPSRIAAGAVKPGQEIRLGGLVEKGSL